MLVTSSMTCLMRCLRPTGARRPGRVTSVERPRIARSLSAALNSSCLTASLLFNQALQEVSHLTDNGFILRCSAGNPTEYPRYVAFLPEKPYTGALYIVESLALTDRCEALPDQVGHFGSAGGEFSKTLLWIHRLTPVPSLPQRLEHHHGSR